MAKMSNIRKKAQDKLRRKYNYSTNDNYGRGTILYKEDTESYHYIDGYDITYDMNICMDDNIRLHPNSPIEICISKYRDNGGVSAEKPNRYEKLSDNSISISLEELDLIHTIAHQMAEENDWSGQTKLHKHHIRGRK